MKIDLIGISFDANVAPVNAFSLTVTHSGATTCTVLAADIITVLGSTKTKTNLLLPLGIVHPYYPSDPAKTFVRTAWSATANFLGALYTALDAKTNTASWGFDVLFAIQTNGTLRVYSSDGTSQIGLTVNNTQTSDFLGITTATAAITHTGTKRMQHLIAPTIPWSTKDSGIYESDTVAALAIPASGSEPYGISRGYSPASHDFSLTGESKASVYGDSTTVSKYGYGFLFEQCRSGYPFLAWESTTSTGGLYNLKPESTFRPGRLVADDDTNWIVDFKTNYIGLVIPPV